jgi:ankyrin repeat protein
LTSDRLADIKAHISRFHIRLEPAHTVIAQACLAILLQSDNDDTLKSTSPLSKYATLHWVDHAHVGNVSSRIEGGMRHLFDPARPYFTAWLDSYVRRLRLFESKDFHTQFPSLGSKSTSFGEENAPLCLYYAAFCGFRDLTRYLIIKYPQHINATFGVNKSPLEAALSNRHIQVAELLHHNGAVLPIGYHGRTLLHGASAEGLADVAQWLISIGADANAREDDRKTPLHLAVERGRLELAQILLSHGIDVNAVEATNNYTPLHEASSRGHIGIGLLLIKHGADVHGQDKSHRTPLHHAGNAETVQLLVKHGADVHARDQSQSTPLHLASSRGNTEAAQLLIKHGADIHAWDQSRSTPLHLALSGGYATAQLLIKHGADVHAQDQCQSTPLHLVRDAETAQLLIENGADVHARDQSQSTPLHYAQDFETAQLLIKHGADVHAQNHDQSTPLHIALQVASSSRSWRTEPTVRLLIEHGACVNAYDKNHRTPLLCALHCPYPNIASLRLLLENGANVDVEDDKGFTPLQIVESRYRTPRLAEVEFLLSHHRPRIVSNTM